MEHNLSPEITKGARLRGNEYGWEVLSFPDALTSAELQRYACLGGQFQFRLDTGVSETYRLSADSDSRGAGETWEEYCERSCSEVRSGFEKLMSGTDFRKQAE